MGAVVVLKSHLRQYPSLVAAYARLLDFVRSMKPPAWKVRKDASGQLVCGNGHIQTAMNTVANIDQRGRAYTSRACLLCFAASLPPYPFAETRDGLTSGLPSASAGASITPSETIATPRSASAATRASRGLARAGTRSAPAASIRQPCARP